MVKKNNFEIKNIYLICILSAILLIAYLITVPDFVTLEDSGLFLMSSYYTGLPQPSGYPLYILASKLFTFIPAVTVALRIHLFNIFLALLSLILIYYITLNLTNGDKLSSFFTSLLLGFSGSFWFQAITAEVYMLQLFLFLLNFFLALKTAGDFKNKTVMLFSFTMGLMFSNHLAVSVLTFPAFIFLLWDKKIEILKKAYLFIIFFILGLTPYIHLFTSSLYSEFFLFYPVKSFKDFFRYVTRADYKSIDVMETYNIRHNIKFFIDFILKSFFEFTPPGCLIIISGLVILWKKFKKNLVFAFFYAIASTSVVLLFLRKMEFTELTKELFENYQLIPFSVYAIMIGLTVSYFYKSEFLFLKRFKFIIPVILIPVLLIMFYLNFSSNNLKKDSFAYDYSKIILESLPENSALILNLDTETFPVSYVNKVEKLRSDITLTSQTGAGFLEKMFDFKTDNTKKKQGIRIIGYIENQIRNNKRIFTTSKLLQFNDDFPFKYISYGLYYEIKNDDAKSASLSANIKSRVMNFIYKYEKNIFKKQWVYHRNVIMRNICIYLMEEKINNDILYTHREGRLLLAEDAKKREDYPAADKYYLSVMKEIESLYISRQLAISNDFLRNRINLINSLALSRKEKKKLVQEAVDMIMPAIKNYPKCNNNVAKNIMGLTSQLPIKINRKWFHSKFKDCDEMKALM